MIVSFILRIDMIQCHFNAFIYSIFINTLELFSLNFISVRWRVDSGKGTKKRKNYLFQCASIHFKRFEFKSIRPHLHPFQAFLHWIFLQLNAPKDQLNANQYMRCSSMTICKYIQIKWNHLISKMNGQERTVFWMVSLWKWLWRVQGIKRKAKKFLWIFVTNAMQINRHPNSMVQFFTDTREKILNELTENVSSLTEILNAEERFIHCTFVLEIQKQENIQVNVFKFIPNNWSQISNFLLNLFRKSTECKPIYTTLFKDNLQIYSNKIKLFNQ